MERAHLTQNSPVCEPAYREQKAELADTDGLRRLSDGDGSAGSNGCHGSRSAIDGTVKANGDTRPPALTSFNTFRHNRIV